MKTKRFNLSQFVDSLHATLVRIEDHLIAALNAGAGPKRFEVVLIGTGGGFGDAKKSYPISMTLDGEVRRGEMASAQLAPDVDITITSFFILGDAKIVEIKMGNCVPIAGSISGLKFGLCNITLSPANRITVCVEGL